MGCELRTLGIALALLASPVTAVADDGGVRVRWLGVAGFSFESGDTVLLHDPYLSRPGLWESLFTLYRPDPEVLTPLLAEDGPAPEMARTRTVLIGHSHFDHLGDAPWIAQRTGATVAGSQTTVAISQGYGLPESQTRRVEPGDVWIEGPFRVRVVESRHAKVLFGRVPLPGEVSEPPDAPIHALSFLLGDARAYLLTHRETGLNVFTLSSAGRHLPALEAMRREGVEVDLLLAAIMGRDAEFARDLVVNLRPRIVVPHHFASFFDSIDDPDAAQPSDPEDLDAFEAEVRAAAGEAGLDVAIRRLTLFEALELSAEPTAAEGGER
jgi:L-ascorbate metabolism protein UlaG (beta-lactamase superfamily)